MKIKRNEILSLWDVLCSFNGQAGVKFCYAVAKNKRLLQGEVESIYEANPDTSEDFRSEKKKILDKYAEKDNKKKPIYIDKGNGVSEPKVKPEDRLKAIREIEELKNEKFKDKSDQYDKLLREEVEINLHQISLDQFPDNISQHKMDVLFCLIKEE